LMHEQRFHEACERGEPAIAARRAAVIVLEDLEGNLPGRLIDALFAALRAAPGANSNPPPSCLQLRRERGPIDADFTEDAGVRSERNLASGFRETKRGLLKLTIG